MKLETQYLLKSFSSRMLSTHSTSRKTKFRTSSSKRLVLRWAHFFYIQSLTINFHFNSSECHQLLPSSNPNWLTNLQNQNKVTGNKKGKKGEFEDAAKYMLTVQGIIHFTFADCYTSVTICNLLFKSEIPNTKSILIPDKQTHLIQLKQLFLSLIGKFRVTCTFLG